MGKAKKAARALEKADLAISEQVAEQRERPLVKALGAASEVGDQPPLIALGVGTIAAGLLRQDRRMTRAGARLLASHLLATTIKNGIKHSVDRTRPDHALDHEYRLERGDSHAHELNSFPSGHTAGAVAVARAAVRDYPGLALPAYGAAAAIAAIQIPRCKHFLSDIAVGAAIGWAAEAVVSGAFEFVRRTDPMNSSLSPLMSSEVETPSRA
jgi:undecaprenyl-diphosphatase